MPDDVVTVRIESVVVDGFVDCSPVDDWPGSGFFLGLVPQAVTSNAKNEI
jgi:hypothetical protein